MVLIAAAIKKLFLKHWTYRFFLPSFPLSKLFGFVLGPLPFVTWNNLTSLSINKVFNRFLIDIVLNPHMKQGVVCDILVMLSCHVLCTEFQFTFHQCFSIFNI